MRAERDQLMRDKLRTLALNGEQPGFVQALSKLVKSHDKRVGEKKQQQSVTIGDNGRYLFKSDGTPIDLQDATKGVSKLKVRAPRLLLNSAGYSVSGHADRVPKHHPEKITSNRA